MDKKFLVNGFGIITGNFMTSLLATVAILSVLSGIVNCSGSRHATIQAPQDIIQNYVAKHETMVDNSLVDLYVEEEQAKVANQINQSIAAKEAAGTLDKLRHATFDFSGLALEVVGEKEEYVNDEPKTFIKVQVSGSFILNLEGDSRQIIPENFVILERQNNAWKVTEKINPWG